MDQPLEGILVVALEQAVAAPYCTSRLADAGARVIKIERAEGDFARGYDHQVMGQSAYFVWLNRGKESLVLDIKKPDDAALLERILAKADVFVQNLAPGAAQRAGFGSEDLRQRYPQADYCRYFGIWGGWRIFRYEGVRFSGSRRKRFDFGHRLSRGDGTRGCLGM
jgi:crotonobetainyl-CoA:carnitine CoA-transferase CaiB-like acyl-CoA transferase